MLECPEEERVVGVSCAVHGNVAREVARERAQAGYVGQIFGYFKVCSETIST